MVMTLCVTLIIASGLFSVVNAAGSKPFAGKKVVIYSRFCAETIWPEYVKAVEDKTGIKLEGVTAPSNYSDLVPKVTAMLSSGDDSIDIMHLDELMGVSFIRAGYLEPLNDVMTAPVIKKYPSDIMNNIAKYQGKVYLIPQDLSAMLLFVNKKMFKDAGIAYPKTEADFMAAAKAFTKGDVYGYGASWSKGGQLFNDAIRWMYAYGGDYLDWTKEGSKKALQKMHDFIYKDKITPPAALGDIYDALNQKFIDGKYAMVYQWPYLSGVMGDKFDKDFEIIAVPTFKTNKTIAAGWHMALNASSKNKGAAKEVLKFIASAEGQLWNTKFNDRSAANSDVLKSPEVIQRVPVLGDIGKYLAAGSLSPRPMNAKINEIMDTTETTLHAYLSNQISLEECVGKGQKDLNRLLGK